MSSPLYDHPSKHPGSSIQKRASNVLDLRSSTGGWDRIRSRIRSDARMKRIIYLFRVHSEKKRLENKFSFTSPTLDNSRGDESPSSPKRWSSDSPLPLSWKSEDVLSPVLSHSKSVHHHTQMEDEPPIKRSQTEGALLDVYGHPPSPKIGPKKNKRFSVMTHVRTAAVTGSLDLERLVDKVSTIHESKHAARQGRFRQSSTNRRRANSANSSSSASSASSAYSEFGDSDASMTTPIDRAKNLQGPIAASRTPLSPSRPTNLEGLQKVPDWVVPDKIADVDGRKTGEFAAHAHHRHSELHGLIQKQGQTAGAAVLSAHLFREHVKRYGFIATCSIHEHPLNLEPRAVLASFAEHLRTAEAGDHPEALGRSIDSARAGRQSLRRSEIGLDSFLDELDKSSNMPGAAVERKFQFHPDRRRQYSTRKKKKIKKKKKKGKRTTTTPKNGIEPLPLPDKDAAS